MEKERIEFSFIPQKTKAISTVVEKKTSGKDYLLYGENNTMPNYLWELYLGCSTLQSIINGTCDFISGNEVMITVDRFKNQVNTEGDTISDLYRKIAVDYEIFGGFAVQILRDSNKDISELYWMDMRNVRLNEDGTKAFYCDKWGTYGAKAKEYEIFDASKQQMNSVYYYKGHISRGVYPIPRYMGGLKSIETMIEIDNYHLNSILNNLTSSAIINFNNGVPSEEEKRNIENKIREKFTGTDNAGQFMLVFNDNKENGVTVNRLAEDSQDDKFQTLLKSTRDNIFITFRATPELFGLSTEGNGFSKEEYLQAFELYNKTVVTPAQKDINRCFDKIFGFDGVITNIPFEIYKVENKVESNE